MPFPRTNPRCDGLQPGLATVSANPSPITSAFTLIELLIVMAVMLILAGLLIPSVMLVQAKVRERGVRMTISELVQAIDAYRTEDAQHRYPPVNGDLSLSLRALPGPGAGTLELLDQRGLWSPSVALKDEESRLLDVWGRPFRYSLVRPVPAAPVGALNDWNWDPAANRVRAWGRRVDSAGVIADGPLAFAYIWSLGKPGIETNATDWIYQADIR